jgi:protein tyrosine phosphatase (PTP) superfamily phosphohydrolase (DUF442 family)
VKHITGEKQKPMNHAPENTIHTITNFLQINPNLGTAGQPTREQFAGIKAAGYEIVINLVPPISTEALLDECEIVCTLGMQYMHIPVIWERPTAQDLERFLAAMRKYHDRKVFVHCVLNMRVSAFVFLYQVLVQGVPVETARMTMSKIWEPNPTWQRFINQQLGRG